MTTSTLTEGRVKPIRPSELCFSDLREEPCTPIIVIGGETGEYQIAMTIRNNVLIPDELKFCVLRDAWHTERGITSSPSEMAACPAYQKIIGMGIQALPLIFKQLRFEGDDPDHWFIALKTITCENPIPEDAYGNMVKMAEAWLSWAEERNV